MKVFIDCDVLLDVCLAREPLCQASAEILNFLELKNNGFIAAHSISNFYYLTAGKDNQQVSKNFIAELCTFLQIASFSNEDLAIALELSFDNFEDAMQCASALACNADVIISRHAINYSNSPIMAITPEEFVQKLTNNFN